MNTFTPHHSIQLKIKGLTLTQEARIIKRIEQKLKKAARHHPHCKDEFWSIRDHRRKDIRPEARATYLAYGFLRGRSYATMEPLRYSDPNWVSIERMIKDYGAGDARVRLQQFEQWKQAAGKPAKRSNAPKPVRIRPSNKPELGKHP